MLLGREGFSLRQADIWPQKVTFQPGTGRRLARRGSQVARRLGAGKTARWQLQAGLPVVPRGTRMDRREHALMEHLVGNDIGKSEMQGTSSATFLNTVRVTS